MGMGQGMMGGGSQGTPYSSTGATPGTSPQMSKEQELEFLKNQAQTISQQLNQINERIKKLEKEK
ncbi:MAG: rRNA methyltransferase, partial [Candidatus Aerophobetes bacterium]|nr:rRNA methyltransferase [Candidatus Aerophobetes bacterium]